MEPAKDRVILYLPANLFHSNVTDVARKGYIEQYSNLHRVLTSAPVPIAVSFQGFDLELLGIYADNFDHTAVELVAAPWAHFLPSLVGEDEVLGASAKWQVAHGVASASAARFNPEFDVPPQKHLLPHAGQIMPCVAPSTVLYSECDVGDSDNEHALMKHDAVAFNGNVLVPLSGLDKVNGAWFTFQRFPSDENLAAVIDRLRELVGGNTGKVYVWYVDLEGPIVGSHFGFGLWARLFAAIEGSDVAGQFTNFAATAEHFRQKAVKLGYGKIARELGNKWTRWPQQLAYYNRWGRLPAPESDFDQTVLSLVTVSDALSAMNSKIAGDIKKDAVMPDGTQKPVVIGYDQTIITVSNRMLEEYIDRSKGYRSRVIGALRELRSTDPRLPTTEAGQFFASRIADVLERFAV